MYTFRTLGVLLACAILMASYGTHSLRAQDDLAQPNELIGLDDSAVSKTERIILKSLRESKPTQPDELAEAVSITVDINVYQDARFYLNQLNNMGLSEQQMFDLHEKTGSDFFFMIHSLDRLQPEGKQFATRVLNAAKKLAVSPQRLDALITRLNAPDISSRSEAFRKLRRLGEPAAAALVNAFAQDAKKPLFPGIRGAIRAMGVDAQPVLLGGARAGDVQVQVESIRALALLSTSEARDVMMRAYLSPKVPEYTRRVALDYLSESASEDPAAIEKQLYERSFQYLMGTRQVPGSFLGKTTLWNWNPASKKLEPSEVEATTAARVIASRRASDLYEIRPDLTRNREMYLLTQLEAAKRLAGRGKRVDVEGLASALSITPAETETVLVKAMELELIPAAVACCEVLGKTGDASFVMSNDGRMRPLVKAILLGDRHLQYAAFRAIGELNPESAYPGSSYMVQLAVFMAQSEGRRVGIVGHNREEVAATYSAMMADSGLYGIPASGSREFFKLATSNPDVDLLMVTDTFDRPDYGELIQQLRNDWRTRRTPIALLYHDIGRERRVRMRVGDDERYLAIPFSMTPESVASHVRQMIELGGPWELTNFDRRKHAGAAIKWLARISGDRAKYGFYHLGSHEKDLARLIYTPGFSDDASEILSQLGTPLAQRELVNFASQNGVPAEARQKAVQAFAKSVKTGGTLLTTREVRLQYDRYNASEFEPEASQKVLGAILDVIEARKKEATESD